MTNNELRIGNFVWDNYSGEMIVTAINRSNHVELAKTFELPSGLYTIDKLEPIQITQEWLLKFGFTKSTFPEIDRWVAYPIFWLYVRLELSAEKRDMRVYFDFDRRPAGFIKIPFSVKYVHELQNIYFSLSGEELQLKK